MDTFLLFCLSFLVGIALRSVAKIPTFPIYLLSLCLLIFIFLLNKKFRPYFTLGLFLFLGVLWYNLSLPQINQNHIAYYNGQTIEFSGVVSQEPNKRENNTQYVLLAKERENFAFPIKNNVETTRRVVSTGRVASTEKIKGLVLITTRPYPEYKYGDQLKVSCKLQAPVVLTDFDYPQYLAVKNIFSLCYYPQITKIADHEGNIIKASILSLKEKFLDILSQIYPEPEASLLSGLLLGGKRSMPANLKEAFIKSGTIHIVAISGYNISIIIKVISGILPFFYISRKKSFPLLILSIFFFVVLTGAESSVVRAAVMGIIASLSNFSGRMSQAGRVLVMAAVIMVLFNPRVLIFDAGFQLSFLATLGLIYLNPVLIEIISMFLQIKYNKKLKVKSQPRTQKVFWAGSNPQLKSQIFFSSMFNQYCRAFISRSFMFCQFISAKIPDSVKRTITESFTNTLAATIMTLPLILYQFGRLSLISVIANVLILWSIPLVMLLGFLNVISVFILKPIFFGAITLGRILAWPSWIILSYIVLIVLYLSRLSIAQVSISWFSLPWLFVCYVFIFWVIVWASRRFLNRKY